MSTKRSLDDMNAVEQAVWLENAIRERRQKSKTRTPPSAPPPPIFQQIEYTVNGAVGKGSKGDAFVAVHPTMPSLLQCPDESEAKCPKLLWRKLTEHEYAAFACLSKEHLDKKKTGVSTQEGA